LITDSIDKQNKKLALLGPAIACVSGIVYPPISHWVWTDIGWLNKLGYVDFSGCGPVHLLGGVCSFVGAVFLGPRLGRFRNKGDGTEQEEIVGHSVPVRMEHLSNGTVSDLGSLECWGI
jgi:ammonia channel protein AmtB